MTLKRIWANNKFTNQSTLTDEHGCSNAVGAWMHRNGLLIFRPAKKTECRTIAELYSISSDGVSDYIWTKLSNPDENILDVGTRRYEQEDSVFSYRSCTIVEINNKIAGMLVAYPMHVDPDYLEEDPVLAPVSRLEEDNSYYICGMALFPEYRGKGIGTRLLKKAEKDCAIAALNKLSLVCFEQNTNAMCLYQKNGYREIAREAVVPHPLLHHTGDAILMVNHLKD